MNRRSFFHTLFGAALAPGLVQAFPAKDKLPIGVIGEARHFNSDGSMSWTRDEIVPCIRTVECPIQVTKFHEADFVLMMEEISLDDLIERYPQVSQRVRFPELAVRVTG